MIGQTFSPAKFNSLDWTDYNNEYGLIAGGMVDGAITLWDVKKILESQQDGQMKIGRGCVSAAEVHAGVSVNAIEFNPHKKNLIASGGSEVLIQDIAQNIKQPQCFKAGTSQPSQGKITSLSWNRSVSHILASATDTGKVVVWDLKQNKSIFNFSMPTDNAGGSEYDFDYYGGGMD